AHGEAGLAARGSGEAEARILPGDGDVHGLRGAARGERRRWFRAAVVPRRGNRARARTDRVDDYGVRAGERQHGRVDERRRARDRPVEVGAVRPANQQAVPAWNAGAAQQQADALPHRAVEELKPETSGSGKVERQRTSEGEPPRRIDVRDGVAWRRREEVDRTRRDPIDGRDLDLAG